MNYYCFIAGLPDITLDSGKQTPALSNLCSEIEEMMAKEDRRLFRLLRMGYDNDNLLAVLRNEEGKHNPLGTRSEEDWRELIAKMEDSDELHPASDKRLLPYTSQFYKEWKNGELEFADERLAALSYEYGLKEKNTFVRKWFEFNLNVNNILTALTCRKYGWDIRQRVVGDNSVAQTIRNFSQVRDFNLRDELDYYDQVVMIAETENLMERENRLDAIKWSWLEENTFFEYFSVERVLSFWLKCELIHRWDKLDKERGSEIFRQMIDEMKRDVKF